MEKKKRKAGDAMEQETFTLEEVNCIRNGHELELNEMQSKTDVLQTKIKELELAIKLQAVSFRDSNKTNKKKKGKKFYAIVVGTIPGVVDNWDECRRRVNEFPGAVFKSFATEKEAQEYIDEKLQDGLRSSPTL